MNGTPGVQTSEWKQSVVGALVAVTAMLGSEQVAVQTTALWVIGLVIVSYNLSRAFVKRAGN